MVGKVCRENRGGGGGLYPVDSETNRKLKEIRYFSTFSHSF